MNDIWTSAYGIVSPMPVLSGSLMEVRMMSGIITPILDRFKEAFQGPYSVVSKVEEDQILLTANMTLTRDLFVARIPITREENDQGGLTVTIGG